MLPAQTLNLGPLVLSWTVLLAGAAWLAASTLHDRSARRTGLPPGPHAWALALVALAGSRLAFLASYWREYASAPWAANMPARLSPSDNASRGGGPPGNPFMWRSPLAASATDA